MAMTPPSTPRKAAETGAGSTLPELTGWPVQPWHAASVEEVLQAFHTSPDGLTDAEAAVRLAHFGPNLLPAEKQRGPLLRFALQFHNLLIYVLLGAAALSFLLQHPIDAAVILAVVFLNAAIGFIQEGRAEEALAAIRNMIAPNAAVLREGRRLTIAAKSIVPGDLVLIEAGDRIPADLRLIHARSLRIDEAALTGESVPTEKLIEPVNEDTALGDRSSLAFSGTFVAAGQGSGLAIATGMRTELGRISALMGTVEHLETPLLRQMGHFAKQLTIVILGIATLTFVFAVMVRDYEIAEAFMIVIGLAVAAVPEELPAILTITLAIGVQRMAQRNAIIRRLPAVETLGSVSVICTDKTGTLTRNEMTAHNLAIADRRYQVTGGGYSPTGTISIHGQEATPSNDPLLMALLEAAILCNDAEIRETETGWQVDGDPMEGALVALTMKAGLDPGTIRKAWRRGDEIPFDARHRFMSTLHSGPQGQAKIFIKGAPENVLKMCAFARGIPNETAIDREVWSRLVHQMASQGQRVLAFAEKTVSASFSNLQHSDVESGAVLLGLIGFLDPPREEAITAIEDCKKAGIQVIMITGDHAETAREISRQLHLAKTPQVITGQDLDAMEDTAFRDAVRGQLVFARTTPEHKLRLVEALQAQGQRVAMTGDGVNDAPALKRADVGIAMGIKGTEAAKEAAQMVLADDNFSSIVSAVKEGRTVYDNILKVIGFTLPANGGEAMTILAAIALGLALPVTAVHILWINMVTTVALGLTLAFEPAEPDTMRRPPRQLHLPILTGDLLWRIGFVSILFVFGAFGVFYWATRQGLPIEAAQTMVVNNLVVMEIFYLFSVRYTHGSSLTWRGIMGTPAVLIGVALVIAAQMAFTYVPALQAIFGSRPLDLAEGSLVIAVGIIVLFIVEIEKRMRAAVKEFLARRCGPLQSD